MQQGTWGVGIGNALRALLFAGLVVLVAVTIAIAVRVDGIVVRVDKASATVLDCKGHGACLPAQVLATVGAVAKSAGTVTKAMPAIAAAAQTAASNSAEASKRTVVVMDDAHALLGQAKRTMADLDAAIQDLDASVKAVSGGAGGTVAAATAALDELTVLEKQLAAEMAAGSPKVEATLDAMAKVANDPAIAAVLKNTEDATYHGAQVVETVDIATRGLRQKVGRVKWLIEKVLGMVKLTIPMF